MTRYDERGIPTLARPQARFCEVHPTIALTWTDTGGNMEHDWLCRVCRELEYRQLVRDVAALKAPEAS